MATISNTSTAADTENLRLFKFTGFDCTDANEVTATIDASQTQVGETKPAKRVLIYAEEASLASADSSPRSCEIKMQAVSETGTFCDIHAYIASDRTTAAAIGDITGIKDVIIAESNASGNFVIGRATDVVPAKFRLAVATASNAGTHTIDIFVEVHY